MLYNLQNTKFVNLQSLINKIMTWVGKQWNIEEAPTNFTFQFQHLENRQTSLAIFLFLWSHLLLSSSTWSIQANHMLEWVNFDDGRNKISQRNHFSQVEINWNLTLTLTLTPKPCTMILERFSNDCRKTKTKAITPTNHNRRRQREERITIPRNYL